MTERLNRREIRHDRFVEDVGVAYGYASGHRKQLLAALGGVLALIALLYAIYWYRSNRETKAQGELAEAIAVVEAPVAPDVTAAPPAGGLQFKSEAERKAKAEPMLKSLVEKYSGTDAADLATLYLGQLAAASGDVATARKNLQAFLDDHSDHVLAAGAQLSLYEMRLSSGEAKQVLEEIGKELEKEGSLLPHDAMLFLSARAHEALGEDSKSRAMYQRIVNEFPDSPYTIDAQRKIAA